MLLLLIGFQNHAAAILNAGIEYRKFSSLDTTTPAGTDLREAR